MSQNELMHYGVPGMRWGHRKANPYTTSMQNAKQRYKSNRKNIDAAYTRAGAAYDKATKGGRVTSKKADRALDAAADKWAADRKAAKTAYKQEKTNIKKQAVSAYEKKFNAAEKASNIADKKWNEVDKRYTELGKNKVERIINAARNKTDAAKAYNKEYDKASRMSDNADDLWEEAKKSYKKTGRTRAGRIYNNVKYGS